MGDRAGAPRRAPHTTVIFPCLETTINFFFFRFFSFFFLFFLFFFLKKNDDKVFCT